MALGHEWTYYLLGGTKEQLSVWQGTQTSQSGFCGDTGGQSQVYFYPTEYLTYGGSSVNITTHPNGTQEYRIADHLGSTRAEIKERGPRQHWDYEPYGKAVAGVPPRKGFIDKEKDKESNLGDFGVRKYDDEIGRFTSPDPLWENYQAWSPYQYSLNNPILLSDPSGKTVAITGNDAGDVFSGLKKTVSIDIEMKDGQLKVGDDVVGTTDAEKALLEAIRSSTIHVDLATTDDLHVIVGEYTGSVVKDGKVIATNKFNLHNARKAGLVDLGTVGGNAIHEILEAYFGGKLFPGEGYTSSNWQTAHNESLKKFPLDEMEIVQGHTPYEGSDYWYVLIYNQAKKSTEPRGIILYTLPAIMDPFTGDWTYDSAFAPIPYPDNTIHNYPW